VEDAKKFGQEHSLPVISVAQLCAYRRLRDLTLGNAPSADPCLACESKMWIDDVEAECSIRIYSTSDSKIEIVTISKGDLQGQEGVPARVHSECFTGDILGSKRCDCGQQLHKFLRHMNGAPCGVLLYIRGHEGRGIGLANKIKAYHLQDGGADTVDANLQLGLPVDTRNYEDALAVIRQLGVKSIRLFTNNPDKSSALRSITKEVVALASECNERNMQYLKTKQERLKHRTVLETFKLPSLAADTTKIRIGVVYTTWNQYYVDELLRTSVAELERAGAQCIKMAVPGATDLVSGARYIVRDSKPDVVIVIGILIRGSSDLYEATCMAVMNGLAHMNASQDIPIIQGVLMCQDEDQAHERTHGPANSGKAWAVTALHMASLSTQIAKQKE
jgi:3,4-dihydroxy 2-butanone 4-phosphate synthase/GTP cyclohydrolase II